MMRVPCAACGRLLCCRAAGESQSPSFKSSGGKSPVAATVSAVAAALCWLYLSGQHVLHGRGHKHVSQCAGKL
jgi:hypothetical protein